MLEVYLDPATINSRKVLAGLELLGMPYEIKHVNYFAGAHKQPDYLALNPNGMLPAAKDGDYTLWESDAILQYAADLSGSDKHYPKDLKKRADINRWLLVGSRTLAAELLHLFHRERRQAAHESPDGQGAPRQGEAKLAAARCRPRGSAGQVQMAGRRHCDHRRHRCRSADAHAQAAAFTARRLPEHPALDGGGRKAAVLAKNARRGRSGVAAALIGIAPALT